MFWIPGSSVFALRAEFIIGPAFGRTRWRAMTVMEGGRVNILIAVKDLKTF
jgi:hypothetical protein